MPDITPEIEQQLANLTDGEWSALSAKVRAPDSTEAFRTAAGRHISGDQLEAMCSAADISKFTGADGQIDEAKVARYMTAVFGAPRAGGQAPQFSRGGHRSPGDAGRLAAAVRHGTNLESTATQKAAVGAGANGRAAAARRHPQKGDQQ